MMPYGRFIWRPQAKNGKNYFVIMSQLGNESELNYPTRFS